MSKQLQHSVRGSTQKGIPQLVVEQYFSAMHFACDYGEVKCGKVIIEVGVVVDALDKKNNTTLHYAVGYRH